MVNPNKLQRLAGTPRVSTTSPSVMARELVRVIDENGLSYKKVAEYAGYGEGMVRDIKRGRVISAKTIEDVAQAIGYRFTIEKIGG